MRNALELYHFIIIHLTLFLTFLKILMLCEGVLFVRISSNMLVTTLDNLEIFPMTPRYLALFTVSFFAFSEYIGKTPTDRTQYNFQKGCPFFIAGLHSMILVMRRRYMFTIDDAIVMIVFATSFSLYITLEYKQPLGMRFAEQKRALKSDALNKKATDLQRQQKLEKE